MKTQEQIEEATREFLQRIDHVLIDGLRLSEEKHPDIFEERRKLAFYLNALLLDQRNLGAEAEEKRMWGRLETMLGER